MLLTSDLEKQIETLQKYKKSLILETVTKGLNKNVPMKSSGIDWIGDIPAHWDINKTKYLFSIVNGSTPESNDLNCWDGDISWITPADMEDFGEIAFGERNITTFGYDSCGTSLLPSLFKNKIFIRHQIFLLFITQTTWQSVLFVV